MDAEGRLAEVHAAVGHVDVQRRIRHHPVVGELVRLHREDVGIDRGGGIRCGQYANRNDETFHHKSFRLSPIPSAPTLSSFKVLVPPPRPVWSPWVSSTRSPSWRSPRWNSCRTASRTTSAG